MGARAARVDTADPRTDAELAAEAGSGSQSAFATLYLRHADAAWRVAYAVTGNVDDASDAVAEAFTRVMQSLNAGRLADAALFRSYLMAATRNAAIDVSRRGGRFRPTAELDQVDAHVRVTATTPGDRVNHAADLSFVAQAFRSLPERWRSVLWLTEVEGIPPKEAAALLGVTPNNAAQLAVRARAGLRERFVQAHLRGSEPVPAGCRFTVERLGGYVTGRLAPRDLAKVDQHLAACEGCKRRHEELEDVGGSLRRVVVPVPMLLGSTVLAKWQLAGAGTVAEVVSKTAGAAGAAASKAAGTGAGAAKAASRSSIDLLGKLQKPLLAASTGIFALGVISASVKGFPDTGGVGGRGDERRAPLAQPRSANPPVVDEVVQFVPAVSQRPDGMALYAPAVYLAPADTTLLPTQPNELLADNTPVGDGALPPPSTGSAGQPIPPPDDAAPEAVAQVGVAGRLGPLEGGAVAGDQCQGGSLNGEGLGCEPPDAGAGTARVTVVTDGSGPAAPLADRDETVGL
jgi:RNA polymerase sigma factor (sigma-70 family)